MVDFPCAPQRRAGRGPDEDASLVLLCALLAAHRTSTGGSLWGNTQSCATDKDRLWLESLDSTKATQLRSNELQLPNTRDHKASRCLGWSRQGLKFRLYTFSGTQDA